jgi:hypothetical protein
MSENLIDPEVLTNLNWVRGTFNDLVQKTRELESLRQLRGTNEDLDAQVQGLLDAIPEKVKMPFTDDFVIAIVGGSTNGKTSILSEMFPGLEEKGWLQTQMNDTTSQSLRIEYAEPESEEAEELVVTGWNLKQIKSLFTDEDVEHQNSLDRVVVTYGEDRIEVDGVGASIGLPEPPNFPKSIELKPFAGDYRVTDSQRRDPQFINALTTKASAGVVGTDAVISHGGSAYNSLQLRVVVKAVCMKNSFERIASWTQASDGFTGLNEDQLPQLTFLDTPGLNTSSSGNDEVLRHPLGVKSEKIVLDLLENDELDIVIHLVLTGQQSTFQKLWTALEKSKGESVVNDLEERVILAMNGTNIFFNDPNLRDAMEKGEHLRVAVVDNVLRRAKPSGNFNPARICFLDSLEFGGMDNTGSSNTASYEQNYNAWHRELLNWTGSGHSAELIDEHIGKEFFEENAKALASAEDCGQGFLMRAVVNLIRGKGTSLLVKKYLFRTHMVETAEGFLALLREYYDEDGRMGTRAISEAFFACLKFLSEGKGSVGEEIERRCGKIDKKLDDLIKASLEQEDWLVDAFERLGKLLAKMVLGKAKVDDSTKRTFEGIFARKIESWKDAWGYRTAVLPKPAGKSDHTFILAKHNLSTHARDILFQLTDSQTAFEGVDASGQSSGEAKTVVEIMSGLKQLIEYGNQLKTHYQAQ